MKEISMHHSPDYLYCKCKESNQRINAYAYELSHIVYTQYDLVRKPSTLDALIGYFTPSHVIYQRLLLQFLSAPKDGPKKGPKPLQYYCSY